MLFLLIISQKQSIAIINNGIYERVCIHSGISTSCFMNKNKTLGTELFTACIKAAGHIELVFIVTYISTVPSAVQNRHIRIIPK
jgi:hypothetical protein